MYAWHPYFDLVCGVFNIIRLCTVVELSEGFNFHLF